MFISDIDISLLNHLMTHVVNFKLQRLSRCAMECIKHKIRWIGNTNCLARSTYLGLIYRQGSNIHINFNLQEIIIYHFMLNAQIQIWRTSKSQTRIFMRQFCKILILLWNWSVHKAWFFFYFILSKCINLNLFNFNITLIFLKKHKKRKYRDNITESEIFSKGY